MMMSKLLLIIIGVLIGNCQAIYFRKLPRVTLKLELESEVITIEAEGSYLGYGDSRAAVYNAKIVLFPESEFACDRLSTNDSATLQAAADDNSKFVVLTPLATDVCSDFTKAVTAVRNGASGVLFYYLPSTPSNALATTNSNTVLRNVPVATVEISEDDFSTILKYSTSRGGSVSIVGKKLGIQTSQTFYFVVFSFCILTVLSCLWFMLSYVRRCRRRVQRRRRQVETERETKELMDGLPVKTHKTQLGVEEPTCAVCLDSFNNKDTIRVLPCSHEYHKRCVDPWLKLKRTCPMCKEDISAKNSKRKGSPTLSTSSDDASSAQLLTQDGSSFSLSSDSTNSSSDQPSQGVVIEDLEGTEEHVVVMFEEVSHSERHSEAEEQMTLELEPVTTH